MKLYRRFPFQVENEGELQTKRKIEETKTFLIHEDRIIGKHISVERWFGSCR